MMQPEGKLLRKRLTGIAGALWVLTLATLLPRTSVSQSPTAVSAGYTLTMLSNGSWLVIGSSERAGQTSTAIVDRRTRQIHAAGALQHERTWHTATALPDGTVLVAGGIDRAGHVLAAPEIFDPARQSFEVLPSSGLAPRAYHSATLLTDGTVLLAGGVGADGVLQRSADIWDYRTRTGRRLASEMSARRSRPGIQLLPDGSALVSGGLAEGDQSVVKAEVYAPWHHGFQSWYSGPAARNDAAVEGSYPEDQSTGIAADAVIGLRFSRRLGIDSLEGSITLSDGGRILAARIVPAEQGRLVFVTPQAPLAPFTHHTLVVSGAKDEDGKAVPYTIYTFTTGGPSNDVLNLTYSMMNRGRTSSHAGGNSIIKAAPAPDPAKSTTIKTFLSCVNQVAPKNIADTVSCIPANSCSFTVTMSSESLQPACVIAGVNLPRVILECPGAAANLRLRPSYVLCPVDRAGAVGQSDHVELGEDDPNALVMFQSGDRNSKGDMFMGDISVDPKGGYDTKTTLEKVAIYGKNKDTCASLVSCHFVEGNPGENEIAKFSPDNPLGNFRGVELAPFILFTNVDLNNYPHKGQLPANSNQKKNFSDVCTAINNNKKQIVQANPAIPPATMDIVATLCTNLYNKVK